VKKNAWVLVLALLFSAWHHSTHSLDKPHGKERGEREKIRTDPNSFCLTKIEEGSQIKIELK
jgi:hypothetical protein